MSATTSRHPRKIISYAPYEVASVEEMMEPNKPLVRSCLPLTRPRGPSFDKAEEKRRRQHEKEEKKAQELLVSLKMNMATEAERKVIKAQMELEREKRLALQAVYRLARSEEFKRSHSNSPFMQDLAAESDRAAEMERARITEAKRLQKLREKKKKEIQESIVKAAAEVDEAEERRRLHRQTLEAAKLAKSFNDVMKAEMMGTRSPHSEELKLRSVRVLAQSPAARLNSTIPHEQPIAEQAAQQAKKDVPVYILQRQQELAERARLEELAKQERERMRKEHEEAEQLRLQQEAEERERQRQKKERAEKRKAEEVARKRKQLQEARMEAEMTARLQVEAEASKQKSKDTKKAQLAEEWRMQAMRTKKSSADQTVIVQKKEVRPVTLFPSPPRSLLTKLPSAPPIREVPEPAPLPPSNADDVSQQPDQQNGAPSEVVAKEVPPMTPETPPDEGSQLPDADDCNTVATPPSDIEAGAATTATEPHPSTSESASAKGSTVHSWTPETTESHAQVSSAAQSTFPSTGRLVQTASSGTAEGNRPQSTPSAGINDDYSDVYSDDGEADANGMDGAEENYDSDAEEYGADDLEEGADVDADGNGVHDAEDSGPNDAEVNDAPDTSQGDGENAIFEPEADANDDDEFSEAGAAENQQRSREDHAQQEDSSGSRRGEDADEETQENGSPPNDEDQAYDDDYYTFDDDEQDEPAEQEDQAEPNAEEEEQDDAREGWDSNDDEEDQGKRPRKIPRQFPPDVS